jgi:hypothetical protein
MGTDERADIPERCAVTLRISCAGAVRLRVGPATTELGANLLTACLGVRCRHSRQCGGVGLLAKRSVARINSSVMPELLAACPASFTTTSSERGHKRCSFHAPASGA